MKTTVCLKCLLTDCVWKFVFDCNSYQIFLNLINLAILVTPTPNHPPPPPRPPSPKQLGYKKWLNFALLGHCISDIFSEV